jgi:hypothetical protein
VHHASPILHEVGLTRDVESALTQIKVRRWAS